jgi:GNAT superfamily N-acetyltransferase
VLSYGGGRIVRLAVGLRGLPLAMRRNMEAFYRLLGSHSPGGMLVVRDGLVAAIVPSCPNLSVVNAVVYAQAAALRTAHDELQAAYRAAGVTAWRVWVPEEDTAVGEWLEQSGHHPAGRSRAMVLDLDEVELDVADEVEWERTSEVADVASLNEQAYGLPSGEVAGALQALADGRAQLYLARERGKPAACVAALDEGTDCGIYCVATRPRSRGQGLATALMRRALLDARDRGATTSSLQSSPLGFPVYQRVGYADLGAIHTWEANMKDPQK